VPSGSPERAPAPVLTLPPGAAPGGEVFLLLPGLNLHPERLAPWRMLLSAAGYPVLCPPLTGLRGPGDPARGSESARLWLDDLDAAWERARARLPGARPALAGYSLGALLGLCWALEADPPPARAVLISPALRLKPLHRALLALLGGLLPGRLALPSLAPRAYRLHARTSVAAYRALAALERRLAPRLRRWQAGDPAGLPALLIVHAPRDELIDTALLAALQRAAPGRVTLHTLRHRPRPGFPRHLGIDAHTLGEAEWERLREAVGRWLAAGLELAEPPPPAS